MDQQLATYLLDVLTRAAILGTLALGLNLAFGYTGIVNLAHVAFAGVSAYTYVIASHRFNLPVLLSLALALTMTAAVAAVFSLLFKNIKSDQLALITLSLALVIAVVLLSWRDIFGAPPLSHVVPPRWQNLTRGALGLSGIRRPPLLNDVASFAVLSLAVCAATYLACRAVTRSPFGAVMAAVRDDELAAQTLGKRTTLVKVKVFILSALVAAGGGILLALYARFIDPGSFYLNDLVLVLTALIIGGLGSLSGTLLGVGVVMAVTESLKFIPPAILSPLVFAPLRIVIYAAVLLLILLVRPRGMLGKIDID